MIVMSDDAMALLYFAVKYMFFKITLDLVEIFSSSDSNFP